MIFRTLASYRVTTPAAQGALLDQYCGGTPNVTCTFIPQLREKVLGPPRQSSNVYVNDTTSDIDKTITLQTTVSATENVEVNGSAKANIKGILELSISAKYGVTWANEYTFTEETSFTIHPGYKLWIETEDPLFKDTGQFAIKLGDTTWSLPGIVVTSPDVQGYPTISYREVPI